MSSNVSASIDAMVAASAAGTTNAGTVNSPQPSMRVSTADGLTGEVEVLQEPANQHASTGPQRIHDSGQDVSAATTAIQANLQRMQNALNEVRFDPRTGEQSHVVTGAERAALQQQLDRAVKSASYDLSVLQALKDQRAADAAAPRAGLERAAAREQFIGTGPNRAERAQAWDAEVTRQEAAAAVAAHLKR